MGLCSSKVHCAEQREGRKTQYLAMVMPKYPQLPKCAFNTKHKIFIKFKGEISVLIQSFTKSWLFFLFVCLVFCLFAFVLIDSGEQPIDSEVFLTRLGRVVVMSSKLNFLMKETPSRASLVSTMLSLWQLPYFPGKRLRRQAWVLLQKLELPL